MALTTLAGLPVDYGYDVGVRCGGDALCLLWGRVNTVIGFGAVQYMSQAFERAHIQETPPVREWIGREVASLRLTLAAGVDQPFKRILLLAMLNEYDGAPHDPVLIGRFMTAVTEHNAQGGGLEDSHRLAAWACACVLFGKVAEKDRPLLAVFLTRLGEAELHTLNCSAALMCMRLGLSDLAAAYAGRAMGASGRIEDAIFGAVTFHEAPRTPVSETARLPDAAPSGRVGPKKSPAPENRDTDLSLEVLSTLSSGFIYMGRSAETGAHLFFVGGVIRSLDTLKGAVDTASLVRLIEAAPVVRSVT